jgi:hypothetical protein
MTEREDTIAPAKGDGDLLNQFVIDCGRFQLRNPGEIKLEGQPFQQFFFTQ